MDAIITEEQRIRRIRQLGLNKPNNYIKAQSKYGDDVDYIPGYDDGEPNSGDIKN